MADGERPASEQGPQRPATIQIPEAMWRTVKAHAAAQGVTASAILAELVAGYLDSPPEHREQLARQAVRWMRPRGPAARGDGDGDSP